MINRLKPRRSRQTESADGSRRSFFWKLGAGVSGAMASMAGVARAGPGDSGKLALRVAELEEERTLRRLHQGFEQAIDHGRYEAAVGFFADDAQVVFNGGVFRNRSLGIRRLYLGKFRSGMSGKRLEPAPAFQSDGVDRPDSVTVAPDGLTAPAVFPYSIQVGRPIESQSSIAGMARLQGNGVETWWEGGEYRVSYRRDSANEPWLISRLEYHTIARANYRPGRTQASAIAVPPLAELYPEDPEGPDAFA